MIIVGGGYWITTEKGENTGQFQETPSASPLTVDNSLPEVEGEAESTAPEEANGPPSEAESPIPEPGQADATGPSEPPVR